MAPTRRSAEPPAGEPALGQAASNGILPVQRIRGLIACGAVSLKAPLLDGQMQPASLDLRLDSTAYRVRASALPSRGRSVADMLRDLQLHRFDLATGAVLETGCVYLVPLMERLALSPGISAATNPKSSTGRLDVFTRVIADGVAAFDQIPAGYAGPPYAEICPQTFPIVVRAGSRLSQIRFRIGDAADSDVALAELQARERLVSGTVDIARGIALSVDIGGTGSGTDALVGYRAKRHAGLIDVDTVGACRIADYWEPLTAGSLRRIILDPDQFYILASKEAVHVPPCGRDGPVQSAGWRVQSALCGLHGPGLRPRGRRWRGSARRARGAQPQGAVHPGRRPDRRPPRLRAHD
jgi:dCTP deaminase